MQTYVLVLTCCICTDCGCGQALVEAAKYSSERLSKRTYKTVQLLLNKGRHAMICEGHKSGMTDKSTYLKCRDIDK